MLRDKEYLRVLFTVALPIILQHFLRSSLNLVSGLVIGQLGDTAVAAVGLANQVFFVLTLLLFGISTGCAIFTSQFWGKSDVKNLRRILGICLLLSLFGSLIFLIFSLFMPVRVIGVFTHDPKVIEIGSHFLRLMSPSFLMIAISFAYAAVLRSTGDVRTPLYTSILALGMSTGLGYMLVFGKFGLPQMGVPGAAVGIIVGRFFEAVLLVLAIYARRSPAAASIKEMLDFDLEYFMRVVNRAMPVAFNELFWSLGVTTYNIVYARISTEAIAAINIAATIENLAFVTFMGISDGCGILIGNQIGAGKTDYAFGFARKTYRLVLFGAILTGGVVILSSDAILSLYKVSSQVSAYAHQILVMVSATLWVKTSNMTMIVGVLRAGGDTRFAFLLDSLSIWLVGVPLAFFGAFVVGLAVHWVYLLVVAEEFVKLGFSIRRFRSRKWINDLTVVGTA